MSGHLVVETALGFVGFAWSEAGLARLVLPERTAQAAAWRLAGAVRAGPAAGAEAAPPPFAAQAADMIVRYGAGEMVDFSALPLDFGGADPFDRAIYAAALRLGFGEVTTYGELAAGAGHPGMARETGAALGRNPLPLVVPCHRILAAGGRIGGFSAPGGAATKLRLLAHEGVRVGPPEPAQASFAF